VSERESMAAGGERRFVDGVLGSLQDLTPKRLPAAPRNVPSVGELERIARDGAHGGPWLQDFLGWRAELERVEASNASSLEAVFGAARAAGKLGDGASVRRFVMFVREVYGFTREIPWTAADARNVARELTQHLDVLGLKARSVLWQEPPTAIASRSTGMGMGRGARP
jgi:hypothetical protein